VNSCALYEKKTARRAPGETYPLEAEGNAVKKEETLKDYTYLLTLGLLLFLTVNNRVTADFRFSLQSTSEPIPSDAIEEIVKAFDKFPIVGLGESHGLQEEADFIARLIRHPAFSAKVNDIVVEFGNALYQDVIDRYIAGKEVSPAELRQVWRNTTQFFVWDAPIYEQFFANIRAINQSLPVSRRLRVLLGDPPVDWSKVQSREDVLSVGKQRGREFYTKVIEQEVLARNRRVLLIYGSAHLMRGIARDPKLEQKLAHLMFVIHPGASADPRLASWPKPSLALVKGTWLGQMEGRKLVDMVDAYLYLGPSDSWTRSVPLPETYQDEGYVNEIKRRYKIMAGTDLDPQEITDVITMSKKYNDAPKRELKRLPIIEYIEIKGLNLVSRDDVLKQIRAKPGERYDPAQVKGDFESVLKMGFFDPLKSSLTEKTGPRGGTVIVFLLSEK
jgi:hypothetical protein